MNDTNTMQTMNRIGGYLLLVSAILGAVLSVQTARQGRLAAGGVMFALACVLCGMWWMFRRVNTE